MLIIPCACIGVSAMEDRIPVGIIPGPFLWVREDFVSGLDLGEEFCGALDVAVVAVWMQLEGFAFVGFFYSGRSYCVSISLGEEGRGASVYSS